VALVGLWYSRELAVHEADPGDPEEHDLILDQLEDANDQGHGTQRGTVAKVVEEDVDALLASERLQVDAGARAQLEERLFWHKVDLLYVLKRRANGDYRPASHLDRSALLDQLTVVANVGGSPRVHFLTLVGVHNLRLYAGAIYAVEGAARRTVRRFSR
jgi:hypothetical protein